MTLNHFNYITTEIVGRTIQAPNPSGADAANTLDSFHAQLQQCKTNGLVTDTRIPNFIAVDFYDKGAVFQFVAELNRVQQKSPRSSAMSPPLSSSASLAAFAGFAVAAATLF
ncbi:hypothetical protein GQ42DRAFT_93510 [Ramicandelaber brevisporus]|nr:hypothetical protein GQ42DRAFT_93510 [Ramicandelaber brevisporus]